MKRVLSAVLVLVMIFVMIPAVGAEAENDHLVPDANSHTPYTHLIFCDNFDEGFMPRNWIVDGNSCHYEWNKKDGVDKSGALNGYSDSIVLQSNYGTKYNKWWNEGYMAIDFRINDFDDLPGVERDAHCVMLSYCDNMENPEEQQGAVYNFYIEIETGRVVLNKSHTWEYYDENGVIAEATTDAILAEGNINTEIEFGKDAPFYEIGWRITSGKIDCYFEGKLVISAEKDPDDPKLGDYTMNSVDTSVATQKSSFLFQNLGNWITLDNFEVWCAYDSVKHEGKEPTCTELGYSPYETCDTCNYTTYSEISETGHQNKELINVVDPTCNTNGYTGDIVCKDCGETIEYGEITSETGHRYSAENIVPSEPDKTHINMSFNDMEEFAEQFDPGLFYIDENILCGYADARALLTVYSNDCDGFYEDSEYTWIAYDTSVTLSLTDDYWNEADRWVNLVYCNDNPRYYGYTEDRNFIAFSYDVQNRCFRLTDGWNNNDPVGQFADPVYIDIDTENSEKFTLGISVERGRIRCFYNDKLIFDYIDVNDEYMIAKYIASPFLLWQDGNFIQIYNVMVADSGDFYTNEATNKIDATCITEGYSGDNICLICGEVSKGKIIPATGHRNTEIMGQIEASCTEVGFTGAIYCYDCNTIVENGSTIPATGHSWDNGTVTIKPTTTTTGVLTYECNTCGEIKPEDIPVVNDSEYAIDSNGVLTSYYGNDEDVHLPEGITKIGDEAFAGNTSITSVVVSNSVTSIGEGAFANCTNLLAVIIPDGVTSIGYAAFIGCTSLEVVYLPDSLLEIGGSAFCSCTNLREIVIPNNISKIESYTFNNCTSLENIILPRSLITIGKYAFWDCVGLESIEIPDGVSLVDGQAFDGCLSLETILIPDSVTEFGYGPFKNCDKLTIHCSKDSTAHKYSVEQNIPYVLIETDAIPGDANNDGKVNLSDVTNLLQYIAKWDVMIDTAVADVTGDAIVNLSDVTRLLQYIAKWDVVLGNSDSKPTDPPVTEPITDVLIISNTQTLSNQTIDTDVYITSTGNAIFENVTINGNIYCYGQLQCRGCTANNVYAYAYGSMMSCGAFDGTHGKVNGGISCNELVILDNALDYAFNKWGKK